MKHDLEKEVRKFLEAMDLSEGDVLLVALSGGKDSVALCHVLSEIQKNLEQIEPFFLAVGHYNHQSRQGQSDEDQVFVEQFVESLGSGKMPCYIGTGDVSAIAQRKKQGFEETARYLRYEFLEETAKHLEEISFSEEFSWRDHDCYILTAHHAQDNIETVFLNLARGSGLQGLCGMPSSRNRIYRPLLSVSVEEILDYCTKKQLSYVEDLSNLDESFTRNRVRHRLIPEFQALNPQFISHTVNTIGIIKKENDYLDEVVRNNLPVSSDITWQGEEMTVHSVEISLKDFFTLPCALEGRALQYVTERMALDLTLSMAQREQVLQIARREKPSGVFSVSSLLQIRREYDRMIWYRPVEEIVSRVQEEPVPLEKGGSILWHGWRITLTHQPTLDIWDGKEVMFFPEEGTYFVRSRQVGDVLQPERRYSKTVKKWCIDEKIPVQWREYLPVILEESGKIVAVAQIGTQKGISPPRGSVAWKCTIEAYEEKDSLEK